MTKIDLDEFGIDPDECMHCGKDKTYTDLHGLPWSEDCKHRGQLLDWGQLHGYPDLQCQPFAIGTGEYCWYIASTVANDDSVWMALAAIEHMEQLKQAV